MQVNGMDVLANSVVGIAATESIARPHALQTKLSFKTARAGKTDSGVHVGKNFMKSNDKKRADVHEAAPLRQSGRIGGFIPELLAGLGFSWPVDEVTSGIHKNKIDAPGCGQFIAGSYSNHVGTRGYKLYIPCSYHGQSMPLLVMAAWLYAKPR
jgi:hypothetical protein